LGRLTDSSTTVKVTIRFTAIFSLYGAFISLATGKQERGSAVALRKATVRDIERFISFPRYRRQAYQQPGRYPQIE
jgi:hypothetical protein